MPPTIKNHQIYKVFFLIYYFSPKTRIIKATRLAQAVRIKPTITSIESPSYMVQELLQLQTSKMHSFNRITQQFFLDLTLQVTHFIFLSTSHLEHAYYSSKPLLPGCASLASSLVPPPRNLTFNMRIHWPAFLSTRIDSPTVTPTPSFESSETSNPTKTRPLIPPPQTQP